MSKNWNEQGSSAVGRECIFKNQYWQVTLCCMIKAEQIRFYNVRKKHVKSIQETIFFVIARPCWIYGLYFVTAAFDRTLLKSRMNYTFWSMHAVMVFSNANAKMKHWDSSGVQKNEIVFKINWKHH